MNDVKLMLKLTAKPLSNSSVANEMSVSVVYVISKSLIDCLQVQVDSVV